MTTERLESRLSIGDIRDGGYYSLPGNLPREQTNLFFTVARAGEVFIKVPTDRGLADYRAFMRDGHVSEADIRALEPAERFDQLDVAIDKLPWIAPVAEVDRESAHYLAVHWLQYDRLRARALIGIPESRFVTVDAVSPGLKTRPPTSEARPPTSETRPPTIRRPDLQVRHHELHPAIFQQRIPGATLWDMFDFESLRIRPAWHPFKATIAAQLRTLLESDLVDHVDWNIKNFVFHGAEQRLYYVDSKPTTFVARSSNDHNLIGIRTHFLA